jgi:hypothetical protein
MNVTSLLVSIAGALVAAPAMALAAPLIDNERVTVWDVTLEKGVDGPKTPHDLDVVVMYLGGSRIRTVDRHGKHAPVRREFGSATFVARGSDAHDTLLSDGTAHEIIIALKDLAVPGIRNESGYPLAFPRPGSVKVLDNSRVVVWRYSWKPGVPTPTHFHDKDFVVAYRYDGSLKSVTLDGKESVSDAHAGEIRFTKGNRSHFEVLTTQRQSAVIAELK